MSPLPSSLCDWLVRHTGFPARRLEPAAELLLLFATVAGMEEAARNGNRHLIERKDIAQQASYRQRAENRKRAHFKCDNRTAV